MKGWRNLNVVVGSRYAMSVDTLRNARRYELCFFFSSVGSTWTALRIDWWSVGSSMYVVFASVASPPIDFEYASTYFTRPSFSYSSYPGRTADMSSRMSEGPLSVRTQTTGRPFLRPSAMKRLVTTSFPTYAGP